MGTVDFAFSVDFAVEVTTIHMIDVVLLLQQVLLVVNTEMVAPLKLFFLFFFLRVQVIFSQTRSHLLQSFIASLKYLSASFGSMGVTNGYKIDLSAL